VATILLTRVVARRLTSLDPNEKTVTFEDMSGSKFGIRCSLLRASLDI
jgi:hypothetical protein